MLVVVALAAATLLAVPFLVAQSTSAAVGRNISEHARAQALAESGIELALAYIRDTPDWRSAYSPADGEPWLADLAFSDGVVQVTVRNEEGDPTAPLADAVIFTSVGRFKGASHTVRTRVAGDLSPTTGTVFSLPYGIALMQNFQIVGNARVNAMDSRVDTFNPHMSAEQAGTHDAVVATNATGAGQVKLTGSASIHGNVFVGPGDGVNPDNVVAVTGNPNNRLGQKAKLAEAMALPEVTLPSNLPSSAGDRTVNNWGGTEETLPAGTYRYGDFTIGGNSTLYIEGDVTIVADGTFSAGNSGRILLREGARLTIYTDRLQVDGNARIKHVDTYDPTATTIFQTGNDPVWMRGSAEVAAGIIAPHAGLDARGNPRLFGAFYGDSVQLYGSARLTQDMALFETSAGGGGGGGGTGEGYSIRWLASE